MLLEDRPWSKKKDDGAVSQGCCNKSPWTWWLRTAELYSPTALETRNLRAKCQKGHAPSEDSREESFLACTWGLQQLLVLLTFQMHPSKLCLLLWWHCASSLLMRTPVNGFRAHSNLAWPFFNLIISEKKNKQKNCISKKKKKGHLLRLWVDMNWEGWYYLIHYKMG